MSLSAERIPEAKALLGEGSIWDPRANVLYWVDIEGHKVFVFEPGSGENRTLEVPGYPSTIVPRASGGALITVANGFAALDPETGAVQMLAEVESEISTNRFNDGKCDPAGRFWAGTMDFELKPGKGSLYFLDTDLSVEKALSGVSVSNGIVWSRDGKTMYYIDSPTQEVHAFDYDLDTGRLGKRCVAVSIAKETGVPDGMTIDEEGMLWVALWGGGAVKRYDPGTGRCLETVEVPGAHQVSSCALGGTDLDELYITTASTGYTTEEWRAHPDAGSLFRVKVGVKGLPAVSFEG